MTRLLLQTRIEASLSAASQLCAQLDSLAAAELDPQISSELRLGLMESLSNIIRHGGLQAERDDIGIRVERSAARWILSITDGGRAIPAERLQRAAAAALDTASPPPAEAPTGGMGLILLYRLFDQVDYRSGAQGNLLRLHRQLTRRHPRSAASRSRPR